MHNRNYIRGAAFERRIVKRLLDMGAACVLRGAGSKSYGLIKADIIAIFPGYTSPQVIFPYDATGSSGGRGGTFPYQMTILIQAKAGRYKKQEETAFSVACLKAQVMGLFITPYNFDTTMQALENTIKGV